MSWTFEQLQKAPNTLASGPYTMAFDGKYVWVAASTNVYVYAYWGDDGHDEYLGQEYYFSRNQLPLTLKATIATGTMFKMVRHMNKMYMTSGGNEIKVADTTTLSMIASLPTAPDNIVAGSLCVANNKLWIVGSNLNSNDQNVMYYYDLLLGTWSTAIAIPGKKGGTRVIVDGYDGHIFVTQGNEHSIAKFTTNGTFVASYRVNRGPYYLHANQDKLVYVVSAIDTDIQSGMLSTFNQTTNLPTNLASAGGRVYGFGETTAHLWTSGGTAKLARTLKSDQDYRYFNGTSPGFSIILTDYSSVDPTTTSTCLVTPQFTYEKWNGASFDTITVKPYLFYGTSNSVVAARLNSMVRVNSVDVLGTAMISVDQQDYYGEN